MRIWDIDPGYLNRQSLLGEHRELHGIVSIITNKKKGYANHPETVRWARHGWALGMRHRQLACEMALRGYTDRSPVTLDFNPDTWPDGFIDPPGRQFSLLKEKYVGKEPGRISFPRNQQELWAQHKYSILARDPGLYNQIGAEVARMAMDVDRLCLMLVETLRMRPSVGGSRNAIQHMWGYVSEGTGGTGEDTGEWPLDRLLIEVQQRSLADNVSYLISSTALAELMVWLPES